MSGKKTFHIQYESTQYELKLERFEENQVCLSGSYSSSTKEPLEIKELHTRLVQHGERVLIESESGIHVGMAIRSDLGVWVQLGEKTAFFERSGRTQDIEAATTNESEIHAPMTGKIVKVNTAVEEQVEAGQILVIMEAMKMEFKLEAPISAMVEVVNCEEGDLVDLGQLLVQLRPDSDGPDS
jgi:acetyl/propionyl-CoA carboxylase alpha subunit